MKQLRLLILFLITFIFLTNCTDNNDSINSPIDLLEDSYNNIPVIVNTENSYTFTVSAKNFSYSTDDILNFSTDSLVITLSLANANSSSGTMKVYNNLDQEIFSESLNGSKVIVKTDIIGQNPKQIKLDLNNFTGQLTAVIATQIPK